ncbi:hypothetical protein DFH27DRAFT_613008 [Peziza echinospora]|nr:hypothetical protein DFH27DRAFT_613008 [Peziza echinospora]
MVSRTRSTWNHKSRHSFIWPLAIIFALFVGVNGGAANSIAPTNIAWKSYTSTGLQLTGLGLGKTFAFDLHTLNLPEGPEGDALIKSTNFTGPLVHFKSLDDANGDVGTGPIILISCDESIIDGGTKRENDATKLFTAAAAKSPRSIIFYTVQSDVCTFTSDVKGLPNIQSLVSKHAGVALLDILAGAEGRIEARVAYSSNPMITSLVDKSKPEGGESSTAVALIVLYATTGIISAFFIVILIAGAIRAHRNPERYRGDASQDSRGGRNRQSRARGIARAALEAIPIVRFGPRPASGEPGQVAPKELDIEMQQSASNLGSGFTSANVSQIHSHSHSGAHELTPPLPAFLNGGHELSEHSITTIPPAIPPTRPPLHTDSSAASTTAPTAGTATPVEADPRQLRCPVCLDDFEDGQELRVLPCRHSFHPDCIDPWLLNVAGSCPVCRIDLRPEDERGPLPAITLPPPPPPHPALLRSNSSSGGLNAQLARLLDNPTRSGLTREERIAALRDAMAQDGQQTGEATLAIRTVNPRSRRPELGVSRLRKVIFGSSGSGNSSTAAASVTTGGSSSSNNSASPAEQSPQTPPPRTRSRTRSNESRIALIGTEPSSPQIPHHRS